MTNYPNNISSVQLKILEIVSQNSVISRREIADKIGNITVDGIKWNISELKRKGI